MLNGAQATVSGPYETSIRDGVEQVDGKWFTKFIVGPVFLDNEKQSATEQQAVFRANIDSQSAAAVRLERNRLLAECDWTVLTDAPLSTAKKTEWKTYRTELRNITESEGFPHTMEWPTKPS